MLSIRICGRIVSGIPIFLGPQVRQVLLFLPGSFQTLFRVSGPNLAETEGVVPIRGRFRERVRVPIAVLGGGEGFGVAFRMIWLERSSPKPTFGPTA